jgi:hypothetical protein
MYDLLTDDELTVLQRLLFAGTEDAFRAGERQAARHTAGTARAVQLCDTHEEIATLFLEAGTELLCRLASDVSLTGTLQGGA